MRAKTEKRKSDKRKKIFSLVIISVLGFLIGFILPRSFNHSGTHKEPRLTDEQQWAKGFIEKTRGGA